MTNKKRSSEISADENQEIFREKVKIFIRERNFFENRGENLKQGEMHHGLRGWTPL